MSRRLILNADDYGLCLEVNGAIEELIARERLSDVSILANGVCWEASVDFLGNNPGVSVGVHLNVVEGLPLNQSDIGQILTGADGRFIGRNRLMARWLMHPRDVTKAIESEWRAQIERLQNTGLNITHLDSHQHFHGFPPAWSCAVKLARQYKIKAMRLPRERHGPAMRRATAALALNASLTISKMFTGSEGILHNDHFLGLRRAGGYSYDDLIEDLRAIPEGLTELAVHPSVTDGSPYSHFKGNRERLAILQASLPEDLDKLGIELVTWPHGKRLPRNERQDKS